MRLAVVVSVSDVGGRVLCSARIDGSLHRDIVVIQPQGLRAHVVPGTRLLVLSHAGDDHELYGMALEFATVASDPDTPRIEARVSGATSALALKSELDAVNARIDNVETVLNTHLHDNVTTAPTGNLSGIPTTFSNTSASITGTEEFHAK